MAYSLGAKQLELLNEALADANSSSAAYGIGGYDGNDTLNGGAGTDWLEGGEGDDVLAGSYGNDGLLGGNGNDTYIYNPGDGRDYITEGADFSGSVDRIAFGAGIALGDLTMTRQNGNDLLIGIAGGGSIAVLNQFGGYSVERLVFADGGVFDLTTLDDPQLGTSGDDVLTGADRDIFPRDILKGGEGNAANDNRAGAGVSGRELRKAA